MNKIVKAVAALAAVALIAGCSGVDTDADEMALHYDNYVVIPTDKSFIECIPVSTSTVDGPGNDHYVYPVAQRTYDFTGANGAEAKPITVTDKDGVNLTVPGIMTFSLNSDCKTLRSFHEQIGRKYEAWDPEGWRTMLRAYAGNPLDKAADQAAQKYTWRQLVLDTEVRKAWQADVASLTKTYMKEQAGAEFFCAPVRPKDGCGEFALTIQKPVPPKDITNALIATQAEEEKKNSADASKSRVLSEADAMEPLVKLLGTNGAILYDAIKRGRVTVVPVPSGSAFNVGGK